MDEDKVEKEEQTTNEENQDKVMEKVEDTKETVHEQETEQETEMKDKTAIVDEKQEEAKVNEVNITTTTKGDE